MHLKRVEIVGFKSFFDKTHLSFQPGVTAVVGPNGCGKSNIADAILWALGEQSAKTLRGERMEDVIFNGTERRKPLGMAEVSLNFSGLSGELEGPLSPYREITLTRRLFRSGESEYLINKSPCRLKDIRELLIDAGAGYHAHTIIEQGKVDAILNASPMQRREIIEETAGIAKYRLRKAEALRKLEATELNLSRVRDIIGEVRRQMNSLDRQAKRAEKYRRLMEEVRGLDLQIAATEWRLLRAEEADLSRQEDAVGASFQGERSGLLVLEADGEQIKIVLTETDARINGLRTGLFEKEGGIQRFESRIELLRSQSSSWQEEMARIAEEVERLAEEKKRLDEKEAANRAELAGLDESLSGHEATLRDASERAARLEEEVQGKSRRMETERQEVFETASLLTEQKNSLYHLKLRSEELQRRREQGLREEEEIRRSQEATHARLAGTERLRETATKRLAEAKGEREAVEIRIRAEEERQGETDRRLSELRETRVGKKGEMASLRSFYEGLWAAQQDNGNGSGSLTNAVEGNLGMVADLIDVPPALEAAIEAVLDTRLRGVVVEGAETVRRAVGHLKESAAGRGVLIPRQPRRREGMPVPELPEGSGIIGMATRQVTPRPGYEDVVEHLLGRALIVKDLDTAFHLWESHPIAGLMVTLDGEVIDTGGMVSGGKGAGEGLLKQKRAIRRLTEEIESFAAEIEGLEKTREKSAQAVATLSAETLWLSELIKTAEIAEATRGQEMESLRGEADRIVERLRTLRMEAEIEEGEISKLSAEISEISATSENLQKGQLEKEQALLGLQGEIDVARSGLKTLSEEITAHRVVVASEKQRRENLIETDERLRREQSERTAREEERKGQSLGLAERLAGAKAEIETSKSDVLRLAAEREELLLGLRKESEAQGELQQKLQGIENEARGRRQKIEGFQQEIGRLQLSRTNLSLRLGQMEENIRNQYQENLAEIAGQTADPDPAVPPEEMMARKERAGTLRQQLSEIGPVNIGAIEEYRELEERSKFLTDQEADLTRSITDLHEAIDRINKTTRGLFVETFNNLNARLAEVFTSFFGGGKAEMVLLEEGNPLESGVEILVQPPGKRLRNVSLLSGGEKALTAISILFASFLIHPGPFCLLDELDAPLDEENTRRFAQAVKKMSEKIQFIVVTHNKRTMEIADTLHGVTMEESGVSKIVSVKLDDTVSANGHSVEEVLQEKA